ncbi:MAG: acyltransferase family protein [Lachnospiraceae bacterium]|nr:acyltransferase family protein [Lachnospiraceae bacterium]
MSNKDKVKNASTKNKTNTSATKNKSKINNSSIINDKTNSKNNIKPKIRNSNIELLRLLLMFMVIILHYNNSDMGGAFQFATGDNLKALTIFEALSIYAVDCFILISGYFMVNAKKSSLKKILLLLALVSGYQVLGYLALCYSGNGIFSMGGLIKSFIPINWFVTLYVVLFAFAPYINVMINTLEKKELDRLLILTISFFCIYPTLLEGLMSHTTQTTEFPGLGTVTLSGSSGGYTIVNFFMMYLIGAYLRKNDVKKSKISSFLSFIAATALNVFLSSYYGIYTSYSNVFVVIQAVTIFNFFNSMNMGEVKIINYLSKSSFSIYLIHTSLFMINVFWGPFKISEHVNNGVSDTVKNLLISVSAMFIVCLCIDIVRRELYHILRLCINKIKHDKK